MTKLGTVKCPYCGKRLKLTKTGKMRPHLDPKTKNPCGRRSPV